MNTSDVLKILLDKLLEWKFQVWSVAILTTLLGVLKLTEQHLIELIPTPKELWAARAIEVILLLLLIMVLAYIWFRKNYVHKKPNFSKVTETQKQILIALESETSPSWIANHLSAKEHFVIRQLEILESNLLVSRSTIQSGVWFLTRHGRAYLYP